MDLPIEDVLPALLQALGQDGRAVLQAPPGAGKTTRVPLALLQSGLPQGRIILLEPRRLAARAAAERMAQTLGESVGQTVGFRMRGATKTSKATKIEVVTEGILTRMLQSDPELSGVGAVIFDEFHERSLNADLGLALSWEVRCALRPDLLILVMSATLDAQPVAQMLDNAPLVTSHGRSYPVDIIHLAKPLAKTVKFEVAVAAQIRAALDDTDGSLLVFLPGEGEIRRTAALLDDVPGVHPLYGALTFAQQRAAIAPSESRKIVLATAIAETALTIDGIRVVIDAGRARRARYDPGRGMSHLVTERVTQAEATQRTGRAGRVAPGVCYRLWTKGEDGALAPFPPPEIAAGDLSDLALNLALWGAQPTDLCFLTPPPKGAWDQATDLLTSLGALDAHGITAHGRAVSALPLHPRLAHMLVLSGADGAGVAALLNDRDPMRDAGADLGLRLKALASRKGDPQLARLQDEVKRLRRLAPRPQNPVSVTAALALAYPDRIAQRRPGTDPRYLLSSGTGAQLPASDPLSQAQYLVACDVDGAGREARIRLALPLLEAELRATFDGMITTETLCYWSKKDGRVLSRQQERLAALVLADRTWRDAPGADMIAAMCDGIRDVGLPWSDRARRLQSRIDLAQGGQVDLPDCGDAALMQDLDWIAPYLSGIVSAGDLKKLDLTQALLARIGWSGQQAIGKIAPKHFVTPLGRTVPIDYSSGTPAIALRLQELFGVTTHPVVGRDRTPLKVTLLSPAQRPIQVTQDIPGFWAGSYADVRKDMRARYPKHPWPEDPTLADPTLRAKRRDT